LKANRFAAIYKEISQFAFIAFQWFRLADIC